MLEVVSAEYLDGYRIRIQFNNGEGGEVDLKQSIWGPVFQPLVDVRQFRQFRVSDVLHTIQWGNGADLSPEHILEKLIEQRQSGKQEPSLLSLENG
jgi:hypothetical protein